MRAIATLIGLMMLVALPTVAQKEQPKPKETPIKTTISAIQKEPSKFDKKMVQVEGKVEKLEKRVSRAGNEYTTFQLRSEGQTVNVFTYGHPDIKEGDTVEVIGRYLREKKVGRNTYKNEIDASTREGGKVMKKEAGKEPKEK